MVWALFIEISLLWTASCAVDLVKVACSSSPGQSYCEDAKRSGHREILLQRLKNLEDHPSNGVVLKERRAHDLPLNEKELKVLVEFASMLESRFRRSDNETVEDPHTDADLREKEFGGSGDNNFEEGFISETNGNANRKMKVLEKESEVTEDTEEIPSHRDKVQQYCDKYEQHFSFYCVGDIDATGEHKEEIAQFCPSYKNACPHKQITSSVSLTNWPSDPFTKVVSSRRPEVQLSSESESEEEMTSEEEAREREQAFMEKMRRRIPCTPDCDKRLYPHCTDECKCDYSYPFVQRFCNPPPLPLFLNVCRLWYWGCPKYAQYHYASQYIYSKAEKGKKLEGPQITNPNPYNIPSPAGVPHIGVPPTRAAGRPNRSKDIGPATRTTDSLVTPPPLPRIARDEALLWMGRRKNRKNQEAKSRQSVSYKVASRKTRGWHNDIRPEPKRTSSKKLFRTLRLLNSLTAQPLKTSEDRDMASFGSTPWSQLTRPRAYQARNGNAPVSAQDSTYGADDDTFRAFYGMTDKYGILHRPRSRSPFSKPGLWEANPDNPHNRDHANKWWYRPYSVNADWLNGQVAWGAHWAVPAAGVGGTDGFSAVFFPSVGTFLNIPDDYD